VLFNLSAKVAVVTGGASGIGLATVRRFRAAGAHVVIADLSDATDLAEELGGVFVRTDVSDEAQVAGLMAKTAERFGRIDILVNNAGIAIDAGPFPNHDHDAFRRQFDVNLMGPVYGIKHGATHMHDGGSIVNTSSMAGMVGFPEYVSYGASKWGLIGITKTAALELAPRGIRVNAVCPTGVTTPMMAVGDEASEGELAVIEILQPLSRLATPEEIAASIHFLASDDCGMITGHALPVDGGLVAGPSTQSIEVAIAKLREGNAVGSSIDACEEGATA